MPSPSHSGRDNGDAGKRDAEGTARDLQRVAQAGDPRFAALSSATAAPKREQACLPPSRESTQPAKPASEANREMAGANFLSTAALVARGVAACSSISTPTRRHPQVHYVRRLNLLVCLCRFHFKPDGTT